MQSLIRSKSAGVTGGRGTAGAGPGRDLLYLFTAVPVGARGWGGGAGRTPAPLSGGGRGDHPPCLGGRGPGPPRLAGPVGGVGAGGVAPPPPCSASGWRPAVPYRGLPLVVGALPPGVRVRSGSRVGPGLQRSEGRPVDRSTGGPFRPEPPLCPL